MHEWSLADAVISTVEKVYKEKQAKRVNSVAVDVGELQNIDQEVFLFGLKSLLKDRPFTADVFHIKIQPAAFLCNRCGKEWKLADIPDIDPEEKEAIHFLPESAHVYLKCPSCRGSDFRLIMGRGVSIGSIELEVDEERTDG